MVVSEPLFDVDLPTASMETFDAGRCVVRPVSYGLAQSVVREAHYLGKLGSTSVSLGMFIDGIPAGIVAFGTVPANNAAAICGEEHSAHVLELTRLALFDWVPRNGESWLIAQSIRWLRLNRADIEICISYADSTVGHCGTIYQATNWVYTGASTGDVVWECDNGIVLHPRTTGYSTDRLPPGHFRPAGAKHRYVTFIGAPARRRTLRANLRWPALPYPKVA